MTEPIGTAEDLARELLAGIPDRLAHTEGSREKRRRLEPSSSPTKPWTSSRSIGLLDGSWLAIVTAICADEYAASEGDLQGPGCHCRVRQCDRPQPWSAALRGPGPREGQSDPP